MKKSKNKTEIAVFISHIFGVIEQQIQTGLQRAAEKEGFHLTYFTSVGDDHSRELYNENDTFNIGDASIFYIPDFDRYEAVIVLFDSFSSSQRPILKKVLTERCTCPVINLRQHQDGFYNLEIDDNSSFQDAIEHLINVHNCEDISLVTGPRDLKVAIERRNIFRNILKEHNLEFREDKVYYGNFWINCGNDAVDFFTNYGAAKAPQAIVCANDYMAISVAKALSERGYRVPEDVIVTGYDNVDESRYNYPSITTVAPPIEEIGETAIGLAARLLQSGDPEGNIIGATECDSDYPYIHYPVSKAKPITIPGKLILRQSCGCCDMQLEHDMAFRDILNNNANETNHLLHSTTTMITSISTAKSIEDCFEIIEKYAGLGTGFKDFALCLLPDWMDQHPMIDGTFAKSDTTMIAPVCICDGESDPNQSFPLSQLLPDPMIQSGKSYYIYPFHFMNHFFGYIAVSIGSVCHSPYGIKTWIIQLENALENHRAHLQMQKLLTELESMYNRDMLTGLYNRHGYETYSKKYYEFCLKNQASLLVMEIDMDSLKYVNDNFGHADGDICIKMIANAMQKASHSGEILVRSGGDEYIVIAKDYSDEKLQTFLRDFQTALDSENAENQKKTGAKYTATASIGYHMEIPDNKEAQPQAELERMFRLADDRMYAEKKLNKNASR